MRVRAVDMLKKDHTDRLDSLGSQSTGFEGAGAMVEVSAGWVEVGNVLRSSGGSLVKKTKGKVVTGCKGIGGRAVVNLGVPYDAAIPDECGNPAIGRTAWNLGRCVVVGRLRGNLGIGAGAAGRGVGWNCGRRGGLGVAWVREGRPPCELARGDVRASTRRGLGVDERRRGCLTGAATRGR